MSTWDVFRLKCEFKVSFLSPVSPLIHSAAHQVSSHCCDKEACPKCEEERAPDVSPDHPSTLHIKEEHDQRAEERGPSCRQQGVATVSPQGHKEPPSHLYRILTVEKTANIKDEPDGDEFIISPSTRQAEMPCGVNPESSGLQRQTLLGEDRTLYPADAIAELQLKCMFLLIYALCTGVWWNVKKGAFAVAGEMLCKLRSVDWICQFAPAHLTMQKLHHNKSYFHIIIYISSHFTWSVDEVFTAWHQQQSETTFQMQHKMFIFALVWVCWWKESYFSPEGMDIK